MSRYNLLSVCYYYFMDKTLKRIVRAADAFGIAAQSDYVILNSGHINDSYRLEAGEQTFVLQKMSPAVHSDPEAAMRSISLICSHIKQRGGRSIEYLKGPEGNPWFKDDQGCYWRAYVYADALCLEKTDDLKLIENAGRAYGGFMMLLSDIDPAALSPSLPIHDTRKRLKELYAAFDEADKDDKREIAEEFEYINENENDICSVADALERGLIPSRICHNDTKLSNVLFDRDTGEQLMVIDLDTVMAGSACFDFGDSIRSMAGTDGCFDRRKYEAYKDGYMQAAGSVLTKNELELLPYSGWCISMELAARYLRDYISEDKIFKSTYPRQSLDKARALIKLASTMP